MSWSMISRPRPCAFGQVREQLEQRARVSTSFMPAAGSSSSRKVGRRGERPGDLDPPLVAVAEAPGELVGLRRRGRTRRAARPRPAPRRRRGRAPRRDRAGLDVLAHGQVAEQPHDLERAGDAPAGDLARRQPGDVARRCTARGPPAGGSCPVIALTSVVLPEPFGPISPRISPGARPATPDRARAGRRTRPRRRRLRGRLRASALARAQRRCHARTARCRAQGGGGVRGRAPAEEAGLAARRARRAPPPCRARGPPRRSGSRARRSAARTRSRSSALATASPSVLPAISTAFAIIITVS